MCHVILLSLSMRTSGMFPAPTLVRGPRVRLHDRAADQARTLDSSEKYFLDYTCTTIPSATLAQFAKSYYFSNTASGPLVPQNT